MITLKDLENFVKKFPELELINKKDCHETTQYYGVMKESPDFEVFEFHNDYNYTYIYLNQDFPLRADSENGKIYRLKTDTFYGCAYSNLNDMEKSLKKVIFMLDNLVLLQKKMKIYEKKLDMESDFNE